MRGHAVGDALRVRVRVRGEAACGRFGQDRSYGVPRYAAGMMFG
jgi:hypothetical protein